MLGSYCYESIREKTVRSKKFAFTPIDCFLINAFSKEEKNVEIEKHVLMTLFAGILAISSSATKNNIRFTFQKNSN